MKALADIRTPGMQERFIDLSIESLGQLRPHIGDTIEAIAADTLGGDRLQTQAGRWCPDLILPGGEECEVKGMGPGSSGVFLHESQVDALDRDDYYISIVMYNCRFDGVRELRQAQARLVNNLTGITLVPGTLAGRSVNKRRWRNLSDGRRGKHITRGDVKRWLRNANKHWRARAPLVHRSLPRPLLAIHSRHLALGSDWWPLAYRIAAQDLLDEIDHHQHAVGLAPAPQKKHRGHMVRIVTEGMPEWYSDLLASRSKPRRANRKKPTSQYCRYLVRGWLTMIIANKRLHPVSEAAIMPAIEAIIEDT